MPSQRKRYSSRDTRTGAVLSVLMHVAAFLLLPDMWFNLKKENWVEVSVMTFPDLERKLPDYSSGRKEEAVPSGKVAEGERREVPVPVSEHTIGIPVEAKIPELTGYREPFFTRPDIEEEFAPKPVPDMAERTGFIDEEGDTETYMIAGPVSVRKILRKVQPTYPAWAEEKGVEGEVELKFWVTREGFVSSVELLKTSGYADLDSRAMEALKKYLFEPIHGQDETEDQWGRITIRYTLK